MSNLTYDEAKKAEGQIFTATLEDNRETQLTLVEVKQAGKAADFPGKTREPFSMFFTSEPHAFLPQESYTLKNDTVGTQTIFLVPVACDNEKEVYTFQAAFN